MADMYSLSSYTNNIANPKAVEGIYTLPNYHSSANGQTVETTSVNFSLIDPVQCFEKKQKELIAALTELGNEMNTLLKCKGKEIKQNEKQSTVAKKKTGNDNAETCAKKDKIAEKEARKNAKQEAKIKQPSERKTENVTKDCTNPPWTVKVFNTAVKDQSLEACNKPELAKWATQALGNIEMTVTNQDVAWVAALSLIGKHRRVAFPGKVGNDINVSEVNSSVVVKIGDHFSARVNDIHVKSRAAMWKILGSSLGIFSFDPAASVQAAHQHQWLLKAERVLEHQLELSFVLREISQYLSRFDTLGSQFEIGVADIVLRSLLQKENNYANNVELWTRRVDTV